MSTITTLLKRLGLIPDGEVLGREQEDQEQRQEAEREDREMTRRAAERVMERVNRGWEDPPVTYEEFRSRVEVNRQEEEDRRTRRIAEGRVSLYRRGRNGSGASGGD